MCVIKTGYSELLEPRAGKTVSLGDVFRSTVALHLFKGDNVTWLTSPEGAELLTGNPHIYELAIWNGYSQPSMFRGRKFDILINLEKDAFVCRMADGMDAATKVGFRRSGSDEEIAAFNPSAGDVLSLSKDFSKRNGENAPCFQQSLFHMIGIREWRGENYILAREPETVETYDVGFNTEVGAKWPTKKWPISHWEKLSETLASIGISVSWQRGLNDLNEYIGWINSCRLLVTNDSLCVHLAQALNKQVIMLVGPTFSSEIFMGGNGVKLAADTDCPKNPCFSGKCDHEKHCMETISPEMVAEAVFELHRRKRDTKCEAGV